MFSSPIDNRLCGTLSESDLSLLIVSPLTRIAFVIKVIS